MDQSSVISFIIVELAIIYRIMVQMIVNNCRICHTITIGSNVRNYRIKQGGLRVFNFIGTV